jgi:hypothetical protein
MLKKPKILIFIMSIIHAVSMNIEEFTARLRKLGLDIPAGTLRRWAAEGLISPPQRTQNPHGRGRLSNWPEATLEEAAACWAVRHFNTRWATPTTDAIRQTRQLAEKIRETPFDVLKAEIKPDGSRGMFFFSYEMHPLVVLWVTAVEKARQGWAIQKPALVTFDWTIEGTPQAGTLKVTLVGVTLEAADKDVLQIKTKRIDLDQIKQERSQSRRPI